MTLSPRIVCIALGEDARISRISIMIIVAYICQDLQEILVLDLALSWQTKSVTD